MKLGDAILFLTGTSSLLLMSACASEGTSNFFDGSGIRDLPPATGGLPNSVSTGGNAGTGGSGVVVDGGSTTGVGGTSGSSGFEGGLSSDSGGTTSSADASGPFNPLLCDFSGTWASYVTVPVTWPASLVLLAGTGQIQQWNLTLQTQEPGSTSVTASTVPCGIFLPDLQSNFFQANAKFGIRFPDALFDDGGIPPADFGINAVLGTSGVEFETDTFAILIGLKLNNPTTASWPGAQAQLEDHDGDGHIGVTVLPATGTGYSLPPGSSNPFDTNRADLVYIAERTVLHLGGPIQDCDKLNADVFIETVNGKPAIDSTVVGCHKTDGSECSADDAAFIDGNRPQFTPSGPGTMINVRVPDGTTCADVRAMFPR